METTAAHATASEVSIQQPREAASGNAVEQRVDTILAQTQGDNTMLVTLLNRIVQPNDQAFYKVLAQRIGNQRMVKIMAMAAEVAAADHAKRPSVGEATLSTPVKREIAGVEVVGSAGVHPEAVEEAAKSIRDMVGKNVTLQTRLKAARVTLIIVPPNLGFVELPEFKQLGTSETPDGRQLKTLRGVANVETADGRMAIAVGEEGIVDVPSTLSNYAATYSIVKHEFGHAIHLQAMDEKQRQRVTTLYIQHKARDVDNSLDTWTDKYASLDDREYFAQATAAFFGANGSSDGTAHNGPQWLAENDPEMYRFLLEIYAAPAHLDTGDANERPAR